ncbi:hypothetical protein MY4824_006110 [Beauveria thailandica]
MPPLRFNQDLLEAQSKQISRVSNLVRGDDSGALKFTYHHDSLSEPVTVHMIAQDYIAYPQNPAFIVFSEFENARNDLTLCLDAVCQKREWSSIEEAVRVISEAITSTIDKRSDCISNDSDSPSWDCGSEYEELDSVGISSTDGDRPLAPHQHDHDTQPLDAQKLASLRSALRKAQNSGITVGIYPEARSNLPQIISLSAPATCLSVAACVLESWGLKETDNLILLIKIGSLYPNIAEICKLSSRQTVLQFRFGKCLGEKPSMASVQSAYRDPNSSKKDKNQVGVDNNASFPFELTNMSTAIDKLLNSGFSNLLGARRRYNLSWPSAQLLVSKLELQDAAHMPTAEDINVEGLVMQADSHYWQSLNGPLSQDGALDDSESFSLPLVAMQFALHRLANSTRYCMVCNACLNQSYTSLKPYVCSKPLCMFQYLSLGLGSSIEYEIINAPCVVDMLICFLYAALTHHTTRELPDGLNIKTVYVDESWARGSYVAALADMEAMTIRDLDYSTRLDITMEQRTRETFRVGDRILIIHREPDPLPNSDMDLVVKSWCRLTASVGGEWTFERYHFVESRRFRENVRENSPTDEMIENVLVGTWRRAQLFGYWQDVDDLEHSQRVSAWLHILEGIPSVHDMRDYLMTQPGRRLAMWNRLNASEIAVLSWTVASNRSLIVQDDDVALEELPEMHLHKAWNKIETSSASRMDWSKMKLTHDQRRWMQFRFLQGSPETEQKFEHKTNQLLETTQTPTIFAWHGSHLKNWHSIIRSGLDFAKVENGRACGNGVYFSNDMLTSLRYSGNFLQRTDKPSQTLHWPKSALQIDSAIAVCELINLPEEFVSTRPHFVVDQLDWIQCRYLLVSINPSADVIAFPPYQPLKNEIQAYVLQDPIYPIIAGDKAVEIPITAIPFDRRAVQIKWSPQFPTAMAVAPLVESHMPLNCNYETDDVELYLGVDGSDDDLHLARIKRRGSSESSCSSQDFRKRAKSITESSATKGLVALDEPRNAHCFDPEGLKMESLRLIEPPIWASTSKQAIRRLTTDLKDLHHRQTLAFDFSSGYYVHTDKSDNMFQWIVELFDFEETLPLARDMRAFGCASIVMEFRFGPNYPISPPFVRVIRPQFLPFAEGGGGHVTVGGAVCLELLTSSGWNPAIHIENVILQIRAALSDTDPPARIQQSRVGIDYGIHEAVMAFKRLARAHGWGVPEDFEKIAAL